MKKYRVVKSNETSFYVETQEGGDWHGVCEPVGRRGVPVMFETLDKAKDWIKDDKAAYGRRIVFETSTNQP